MRLTLVVFVCAFLRCRRGGYLVSSFYARLPPQEFRECVVSSVLSLFSARCHFARIGPDLALMSSMTSRDFVGVLDFLKNCDVCSWPRACLANFSQR